MKKRTLLLIAILAVSVAACAVPMNPIKGSGNVVSESRNVNGFDHISFEGFGKMFISQGDEEALRIEAEDNILPLITTEVRNGTLIIAVKDLLSRSTNWGRNIQPTKPVNFYLITTDLNQLDLSGAGIIDVSDLDSDRLVVNISGAGEISLSGQVTSQDVILSGAGAYNAQRLESESVDLSISGAGSAMVWAKDHLDVSISGIGSVSYYGNPEIRQGISGFGILNYLGER